MSSAGFKGEAQKALWIRSNYLLQLAESEQSWNDVTIESANIPRYCKAKMKLNFIFNSLILEARGSTCQ
jgi:hypothetical protein